MRSVLTISLPQRQAQKVKQQARRRGFETLSHYFRFLVESDQDLISEAELLKISKEAEADYRAGKLKHYRSIDEVLEYGG